ncbi:17-beta-hydroxysteroid dehydrogenase [Lasiodiplodia theobromae]|uniref:17-beta-hydroxysteroid dehydrogenase n=1 Tax=Lasiodiplodia theobromae TaxID=45133 RepID=UPI0015C2DB60|nr:17-beta-hydroxysteroid dehydrogenase [Lasiodiplodia theobromae]KAF4538861.1 17-beta-hydroxysteroid dehydrogenase [Lasiodiplodia theobromae]
MLSQSKPLSGKVAIVTGSSRGIGAAILLKLASCGADVVVNYVSSQAPAESVAAKAREFGVKAICIRADVSKREEIAHLFDQAKKELGRVDVVMSNSGIEHFGDLETVKEEEIDRVLAVNVKAQFFVAQEAHKYLEDGGRLILISSISAVWGVPRHALYSASKAAITGMVKCLACDFGSRNITVNCIAPGGIKSDMYTEAAKEYFPGGDKMTVEEIDEKAASMSPMKRPGFPDDVAGVVALLAMPESQWMTGQTFHVGGGAHMATA